MKYIIIILLLVNSLATGAQSQNVGIGTFSPAASAQLDVSSNTKGFLPPRMDSIARNAIVSPAAGLIIYNTSINAFQCYNGTTWYSTVHYIGERYGGGIIFYVYDNGQHGLISSTADQAIGVIRWYGGLYTNTMSLSDGIGAGKMNTELIIASQGYGDGATYAARLCNEYSVSVGGVTYSGWYLPSKFELNLLYLQNSLVGGFTTSSAYYWTSTENDANTAWIQSFINGSQGPDNKNQPNFKYLRAIRSF